MAAGDAADRRRRRWLGRAAVVMVVASPLAWLGVVHDYAIPLRWSDAHVHALPLLAPVVLVTGAVALLLSRGVWRWLAGVLLLVVAINAWVASLLMWLPLVLLRP